jgi:hypothetical protein
MASITWSPAAWGAGAIPSPILIARVRQTAGIHAPAIHVIPIVMVIALTLPLLARRHEKLRNRPGYIRRLSFLKGAMRDERWMDKIRLYLLVCELSWGANGDFTNGQGREYVSFGS